MARVINNKPFDKRRYPFGAVDSKGNFKASGGSNMYRGRLETKPTKGFGPRSTIYQLFFNYNPTSFSHSSAVDPGYNPATLYNDTAGGSAFDPSPFLQLQGSLNFSLLFDRTYETWHRDGSYLSEWGVMADVKVLYAMLGMYESAGAFNEQDGTFHGGDADPQRMSQLTPTSVHLFAPMWAIFGPRLKYYGALTNFNLTYTHFTQNMVPNRATLEVGFQLLPESEYRPKSASQIGREAAKATGNNRPWKAAEVG